LLELLLVLAIPCAGIGAEPLMRMRLQNGGARSSHFPAFVSKIARSTDLVQATMGSREFLKTKERSLTSGLFGPIHIDDDPVVSSPIP
jgi:hypothetical protein